MGIPIFSTVYGTKNGNSQICKQFFEFSIFYLSLGISKIITKNMIVFFNRVPLISQTKKHLQLHTNI